MVKDTHNFVARFGASRSSGGTRPFDSASSQKSSKKTSTYRGRVVRSYEGEDGQLSVGEVIGHGRTLLHE